MTLWPEEEDLTVFLAKNITDFYDPKFAVKYMTKIRAKFIFSYNIRKHLWFLFYKKNDAAVKLRIKVNTYLPLDYQLFYRLNRRTVFAYD